ncbi:prepilin peptidase [Cognaticolwellia mytili]|uniref:prepilin peptidase n=1 Tax=Cognaticolwellia mytili TaxID=1888913 RepID=UPI002E271A5E
MTDFISLMSNNPTFFFGVTFVFSLMIGSFLNVVILRLPKMLEQGWKKECREFLADEITTPSASKNEEAFTLSTPRSSCPSCQHRITFYENIPIISWLFLRGKCSRCHTKISLRYPIVELTTALLSVVISAHFGVTFTTLMLLILTWGLVCLTLIDLDHMLLPDQITLPLLWLGLLVNLNDAIVPLSDAVIGAIAGYTSLFSIVWLFKLCTGKEGMGHGDFKLLAVFGAWIGWQLLPLLILMASAVGAIIGISMMTFKNHQREQPIPFGPYLAVAGWITLLWGNGIWAWYLSYLY